MSDQNTIRCVIMRGGTSKGLYFHATDLPAPGAARDALLQRLMGSPDILQIDGLGGSRPITSKVAIIAPSERDDADIDYTFAQIGIDTRAVSYTGNCGNISTGVAPFAIDEGLVNAHDGHAQIRIYNTNTDKILIAKVLIEDGKAKVEGDCAIAGVPGTGAEIVLDWTATIGAKTGKLLPTGHALDTWTLASGEDIEVTLCDAANPCIWVRASALGLSGSELSDAINADQTLIDRCRELRGKAAVAFSMCDDWRHADEQAPAVPMVGLVAEPADYVTLSGEHVAADAMDLRVRLMFENRLHESIAGTGSMCLAAASRVTGSVVQAVTANTDTPKLCIGHPSGITSVQVEVCAAESQPFVMFDRLGLSRTARRLADCNAYYPLR